MKRTVEYLGKSEDGFAEYEISESIENDSTSKVYKPEKIEYPRPKESQTETSSPKGINPNDQKGGKTMELNKDEFLKTEFGVELKSTIELLDRNLITKEERSNYWSDDELNRCKDAIKRLCAQWDIFQLALKQFYGIEYAFTLTDEYFGVCTEDESNWLFKIDREMDGKGE